MYIKHKYRHNLLFGILILSVITSCALKTKNDKTEVFVPQDVDRPVAVHASISVSPPKHILYINNQSSQGFSQIPFSTQTMPTLKSLNGGLFSAVGNGGLGVTALFDEKNTLELYQGIPVYIDGTGVNGEKPHVFLSGTGDKNCNSIFTYDAKANRVAIDESNLNKLTFCSLEISASLAIDGKITSDVKKIDIVINPTLAKYAEYNDSTYRYLDTYTGLNKNLYLLAKWLNDPIRITRGLILRFNEDMEKAQVNISNMNALTGVQTVTKIDLSGTDIRDLSAIAQMNNLEEIDLSNCKKLEPNELAILGKLENLKKLIVRNMEIKALKVITDNIKSLEELDISGNKQIRDLENIENLPNLRTLHASNIGLQSLAKLSQATQIVDLDISENELSNVTNDDLRALINLYNLESLNISESHLPLKFVDDYFEGVYRRKTLKKFVDANHFVGDRELTDEECAYTIHNYGKFINFKYMTSLEYIDIHGNRCDLISESFFTTGMYETSQFVNMEKLKYLDISDNPVNDLWPISKLSNLQTLHLAQHPLIDKDGKVYFKPAKIAMTPWDCNTALKYSKFNLAQECSLLKTKNVSKTFTTIGQNEFSVPSNVTEIEISTCGSGGGSSGETGTPATPSTYWTYSSTTYPGNPDKGTRDRTIYKREEFKVEHGSAPSPGALGESGKTVTIKDKETGALLFASSTESFFEPPIQNLDVCRGGKSVGNGSQTGSHAKLVSHKIPVRPNQVILIDIPNGGLGGEGGAGGQFKRVTLIKTEEGMCEMWHFANDDRCNGYNGKKGKNGEAGSPGYAQITYGLPER